MNALEELADSFSRLPGIGKKSATRLAQHILKSERSFAMRFARQISEIHDRIHACSICGCYTEDDPCTICSNPSRDRTTICVVEQAQDVQTIENSHEYTGLFHVLGGVIAPLDGIGPDQLAIASLIKKIQQGQIQEIILATNPTVEGDTTALYIQRLIAPLGIKVTRLASGLPVGGDLEYADRLTLSRSLRDRVEL